LPFCQLVVYDLDATFALFSKVSKIMAQKKSSGKPIKLYLSIEKRINFTLDDLKETATAYDHFRSMFSTTRDTMKSSPFNLLGRQLPIDFSACFDYERTAHLEVWEIWQQ